MQTEPKTFSIIRVFPKQQVTEWMNYLQSNNIQTKQIRNLLIMKFEFKEYFLLSDLLAFHSDRKLFKWTQIHTSELIEHFEVFKSQIQSFKVNYTTLSVENFLFARKGIQLRLISIPPKQESYQTFENYEQLVDRISKEFMKKNGNSESKSIFEFVSMARTFVHGQISIQSTFNLATQNDIITELILRQQIRQKLYLYVVEPQQQISLFEDIFNLIQRFDDELKSLYIEKFLVEKSYSQLVSQIYYLLNLKKKQSYIVSKIEVLNQTGRVDYLQKSISNQIYFANSILNIEDEQNQEIKFEDFTQQLSKSIEKSLHFPEQIQQPFFDQTQSPIIFLSAIHKQYWIFHSIQLEEINSDMQRLISKFISEDINFHQNLSQDAAPILLDQIVSGLQYNDPYKIIEKLLEIKINQIINKFISIVEQILGLQNDYLEPYKKLLINKIQEEKQRYMQTLHINLEWQNDILHQLLVLLKQFFFQIISEQQNKHQSETASSELLYEILDNCTQGVSEGQQQILLNHFLQKFVNLFGEFDEFQSLKNEIKKEYFKEYINFFCKVETIYMTTKFQSLLIRLNVSLIQYKNFRDLINKLFLPIEGQFRDFEQALSKAKNTILAQFLCEHLFQMKDMVLQFNCERINLYLQKVIFEELKVKLEQKRQYEEQIVAVKQQYIDAYIPFEYFEPSLKFKENFALNLQNYQTIIEYLKQNEQNDIGLIPIIKQKRIDEWQVEKQKVFEQLKNQEPKNWNVEQLKEDIEQIRFGFFLPERQEFKLKSAITQIHNLFYQECYETLTNPPDLVQFDLDKKNKYKLDFSISVNENERLFTISKEFLEQVYKFYEEQIQVHLQNQLNEIQI